MTGGKRIVSGWLCCDRFFFRPWGPGAMFVWPWSRDMFWDLTVALCWSWGLCRAPKKLVSDPQITNGKDTRNIIQTRLQSSSPNQVRAHKSKLWL